MKLNPEEKEIEAFFERGCSCEEHVNDQSLRLEYNSLGFRINSLLKGVTVQTCGGAGGSVTGSRTLTVHTRMKKREREKLK